jgi:hypothetical protein
MCGRIKTYTHTHKWNKHYISNSCVERMYTLLLWKNIHHTTLYRSSLVKMIQPSKVIDLYKSWQQENKHGYDSWQRWLSMVFSLMNTQTKKSSWWFHTAFNSSMKKKITRNIFIIILTPWLFNGINTHAALWLNTASTWDPSQTGKQYTAFLKHCRNGNSYAMIETGCSTDNCN